MNGFTIMVGEIWFVYGLPIGRREETRRKACKQTNYGRLLIFY